MKRHTKIICTIGPSVSSLEKIKELIDAGMNVARLNFSHGTYEEHKKRIDLLKQARLEKKVPLAIMLDTKGPEIRVGVLENPYPVTAGQKVLLVEKATHPEQLPITPPIALQPLKKGNRVLFDDGYIASEVLENTAAGVLVQILNKGIIKSQKGVNMPHVDVPLPAMTERDIADIKFGCAQDIDLIAASFIRSAEHVRAIKALLEEQNKPEVQIISKIENSLGVENFDSIIQVTDGIMIARGDLGVELPIEQVPLLQKMMTRKALRASKPVVIATQMLESMIQNPRPTRAEASDVANAIYDSATAVMLSGETAVGQYPIETVQMMRGIIEATEADFPFRDFFYHSSLADSNDIPSSIALASVKTAYSSDAQAIFAFTSSGFTAGQISRYRPKMPIIALTSNAKTYHQLAFHWGVIPVEPTCTQNIKEAFDVTSHFAREHQLVQFGDIVVVTAGTHFGERGTTNMMVVESIGEVLVRGKPSQGKEVKGQIFFILNLDQYSIKGAVDKIVVLSKYEESFLPAIKHAKAVILQNSREDLESEKKLEEIARHLHIPILMQADGAFRRLQDGQIVSLNVEKGTVYRQSLKT